MKVINATLKFLQKFGLSTDFKPNKMDSVSKFSLFQKSAILKRRFWKIYIPLSLQFVVIICYTTVLYNKQSIVFGVLLLTWRKLDSTINTKKFANWQIFRFSRILRKLVQAAMVGLRFQPKMLCYGLE